MNMQNSQKDILPSLTYAPDLRSTTTSSEFDRQQALFKRKFTLSAIKLKKLLNEDVAIFTCVYNNKFVKMFLPEVVNYLKSLKLYNTVLAIHACPNPNFIYVKFENSQHVQNFKDLAHYVGQNEVMFINGLETIGFCNIFIDKIPVDIITDHLSDILMDYGRIQKIMPTLLRRDDGKMIQYGQTKIEFQLLDGISIFQIPYFIRILDFKVYLHIPNRPKICFRCMDKSHLVSECRKRYCPICMKLKEIGHECIITYAMKAKNTTTEWPEILQYQMEDEILIDLEEPMYTNDLEQNPILTEGENYSKINLEQIDASIVLQESQIVNTNINIKDDGHKNKDFQNIGVDINEMEANKGKQEEVIISDNRSSDALNKNILKIKKKKKKKTDDVSSDEEINQSVVLDFPKNVESNRGAINKRQKLTIDSTKDKSYLNKNEKKNYDLRKKKVSENLCDQNTSSEILINNTPDLSSESPLNKGEDMQNIKILAECTIRNDVLYSSEEMMNEDHFFSDHS